MDQDDLEGMQVVPMGQLRKKQFEGVEAFGQLLIKNGKDLLLETGRQPAMIYGIRVKADNSALMNIISANDFLSNKDGKQMLVAMLKAMADTFAWTHVYMLMTTKVTVVEQDSPIGQLLASGALRMQDIPNKKEALVVQIFQEDTTTHAISSIIERDESKNITGFKDKNSTFKDAQYKTESLYNPWRKDGPSNSGSLDNSPKK